MSQLAIIGGFISSLRRNLRERNEELKGALSVCIRDIDHFKPVNETYGHQAGNDILREVARAVSGSIRQIDCSN